VELTAAPSEKTFAASFTGASESFDVMGGYQSTEILMQAEGLNPLEMSFIRGGAGDGANGNTVSITGAGAWNSNNGLWFDMDMYGRLVVSGYPKWGSANSSDNLTIAAKGGTPITTTVTADNLLNGVNGIAVQNDTILWNGATLFYYDSLSDIENNGSPSLSASAPIGGYLNVGSIALDGKGNVFYAIDGSEPFTVVRQGIDTSWNVVGTNAEVASISIDGLVTHDLKVINDILVLLIVEQDSPGSLGYVTTAYFYDAEDGTFKGSSTPIASGNFARISGWDSEGVHIYCAPVGFNTDTDTPDPANVGTLPSKSYYIQWNGSSVAKDISAAVPTSASIQLTLNSNFYVDSTNNPRKLKVSLYEDTGTFGITTATTETSPLYTISGTVLKFVSIPIIATDKYTSLSGTSYTHNDLNAVVPKKYIIVVEVVDDNEGYVSPYLVTSSRLIIGGGGAYTVMISSFTSYTYYAGSTPPVDPGSFGSGNFYPSF
jgi:hypothetical protein